MTDISISKKDMVIAYDKLWTEKYSTEDEYWGRWRNVGVREFTDRLRELYPSAFKGGE